MQSTVISAVVVWPGMQTHVRANLHRSIDIESSCLMYTYRDSERVFKRTRNLYCIYI